MRRALPLVLAIAAFLIAALIWIGSTRTGSHVFDRASASNTSPTGLSLAYAYLGRQPGMAVTMLTTPLRSGMIPSNAVVIRVEEHETDQKQVVERDDDEDPVTHTPQSLLTSAEDEFVRGGGRLVLANNGPRGSLAVRGDAGKVAAKVFPIWPGLDTLALPEPRGLAPRSLPIGMHALFAANGEVIVARQEIGAGDVIVVSVPEMFENRNVASDHHLQLLLAIAAEPAAVQPAGRRRYAGRPVYFDEVVHGMAADDGSLAILTDWRLGPLLVLLFIAALLTLWRNSKRVGPAEDEDRDTRSDANDLVASLGALYARSMSSAESIALYHAALERSVAAQSGLRGDALHKRVAELTHGFAPSPGVAPLPAYAFQRQLNVINDAFRTLERSARGGHDANHR